MWNSSVFSIFLNVLNSSACLQSSDSEFQTEGALIDGDDDDNERHLIYQSVSELRFRY